MNCCLQSHCQHSLVDHLFANITVQGAPKRRALALDWGISIAVFTRRDLILYCIIYCIDLYMSLRNPPIRKDNIHIPMESPSVIRDNFYLFVHLHWVFQCFGNGEKAVPRKPQTRNQGHPQNIQRVHTIFLWLEAFFRELIQTPPSVYLMKQGD